MSLVCPVCYEEYSATRPARILRNCGHDFCDVCIRRAVRCPTHKLLRCPSCRTPMMSADVASDHLRILASASSDRESLADLLMEELFPKSVALTHIHSRIELSGMQRQELTVRDCETNVLMVELCHRIPLADDEGKAHRVTPEADAPPPPTASDRDKDASALERKVEMVMAQMAKNLSDVGLPRSYTDGLEDVSLSMIWIFILWLFQAFYNHICFAPNRYWRKCRPEEKIQLLALAQGIPLFIAACYYCARVSR